mgnify:CR=1 FL=1
MTQTNDRCQRPTLPLLLTTLVALLVAQAPPVFAQNGETASAYETSYKREADGKYRQALDALEKASASERTRYIYLLRKGWLLYNSGEYANAIDAYRKAAEAEPKAVEPLAGLMLPQMALRRWKDATQTAQKALRLDPNNYLAKSRYAWALYNLGRFSESEQRYREVLALYPSDADMRSGLGWALLKQGKSEVARKQFERVLEFAPEHASATEGLRQAGGS